MNARKLSSPAIALVLRGCAQHEGSHLAGKPKTIPVKGYYRKDEAYV